MNLEINENERNFLENVCCIYESTCYEIDEDQNIFIEGLRNKIKLLDPKRKKRMTYKEQFNDALKKYWINYIAVIAFALLLLYKGYSHADVYRNSHIDQFEKTNISSFENQLEMGILNDFYTMNAEYDACDTYTKKRDFHKRNAERCFNDAKQMCWLLPPKMRDKSYYAFSNITILACPGEPASKLITCLVSTLILYGIDAHEEWANMNTKLHWAEYHWDQYELFCDVVKTGNLRLN